MVTVPPEYQRLDDSHRPAAANARRLGPSPQSQAVAVSVYVRRKPSAPGLPDQDYWADTPVRQRKFPTRRELADLYGADDGDCDRVLKFAAGHRLEAEEPNPARLAERRIVLHGTVAQMNEAFAVDLSEYQTTVDSYRGYDGFVHIPRELAGIVKGVFGLDTRRVTRPLIVSGAGKGPFLSPLKVAELYNFPEARDMSRQAIGVLAFSDPNNKDTGVGGYLAPDIGAYFTTYQGIGPGAVMPAVRNIFVGGAGNDPAIGSLFADAEITGDIQVVGTVAPGANISVYFTTWDEDGWLAAIKRMIYPQKDEPEVSVVSISYAAPETSLHWSRAAVTLINETFQEAAAAGMTIVAASGDHGSNCKVGGIGTEPPRAHVGYPASDPWVTACGGTVIQNVIASSFTEATWIHTGGGISELFDLPAWQAGANVPLSVNPGARRGRGVPDISGYANGYCVVMNGSRQGPFAGTSGVAPVYAGLVARINAILGHPVGYLNPALYQLGIASGGVFRDIADGTTNASGGAPGYVSVPGWNACNGWGSIDGLELLRFLS